MTALFILAQICLAGFYLTVIVREIRRAEKDSREVPRGVLLGLEEVRRDARREAKAAARQWAKGQMVRSVESYQVR